MAIPLVSRIFIYTAIVAVIAGAAMAHRPASAGVATAHAATVLS